MRVAVTGSSGLVGSRLVEWLKARGDEVLPIRRSGSEGLLWSPDGPVDLEPKDGVPIDAVVHLAGAPIAGKRWSESYKQEIRRSRVEGTRALVAGLAALQTPPKVLVSASAVAVYGPGRGQAELTEDDCDLGDPSDDFLTRVGRDWELEAAAYDAGRVVLLRLGIVLSSEGGALEKMVPPFKMFVGGPLGDGKQYMSWVELEDVVRGIGHALDTAELERLVNQPQLYHPKQMMLEEPLRQHLLKQMNPKVVKRLVNQLQLYHPKQMTLEEPFHQHLLQQIDRKSVV